MRTTRIQLALFAMLAGCAATSSPDAGLHDTVGADADSSGCVGGAPELSACARGYVSADCGGTGEPTFACSESSGECVWFAASCVAQGYRRTECEPSEPCCVPRYAGTWPYTAFDPTGPPLGSFVENVAAYASLPVGPGQDYPIAVTYDAAGSFGEPGVVCEPATSATVCSATVSFPPAFAERGDEWVLETRLQAGPFPITLAVVLGSAPSPTTARAYFHIGADASWSMMTCEHASTPTGVVTGTVVLNQSPTSSGTHGEASLELPDGTHLVVSL